MIETVIAVAAGMLLLVCTAAGGELKINVQSFPPGQPLRPGVAVLLSVDGLEAGQVPVWHRVEVEGDIVLRLQDYHLFAGTMAGPRTFIVQVPSPGADPFAITTFQYGEIDDGDEDENPPVPPVPPGEIKIVTVNESFQPDPSDVLLLAQLTNRLEDQGHDWERADPDIKEDDKTPAWLQPVLDRIEKDKLQLPVVAVVKGSLADGFGLVAIEERPESLEKAVEFLKKHGVD
jgi:hypothetical protein